MLSVVVSSSARRGIEGRVEGAVDLAISDNHTGPEATCLEQEVVEKIFQVAIDVQIDSPLSIEIVSAQPMPKRR
jgi:hypothetical protein